MDSVKAKISGDGVDSSVEFSVEEVMARHQGRPWGEISEAERQEEMKAYALSLFSRHTGQTGELQVTLEGGTFTNTLNRNV